jgi:hypothetical protein
MSLVLFAVGTIVTVDRIEGAYAVLEWRDSNLTEVPITALPPGLHEGDRLLVRARTLPPSSVARRPGRRPRGAAPARRGRAD